MLRKILIILITTTALTLNVNAASDGNLLMKKNDPTEVKDCFEGLNRATFALNEGLDKAIFKPIAKNYRNLPPPIKTGTGNILDNLSNLITIPNNVQVHVEPTVAMEKTTSRTSISLAMVFAALV